MRRRRLIRTSLSLSILSCLLLLLGCGSGGSTSNSPPGDNTPTAITGRVLTPDGTMNVAQRSSRQLATGGVTVSLGTVDNDALSITPLNGTAVPTDAQGSFSIPLPRGTSLGPTLNVFVGDPDNPLLAGVCVQNTTDLSPAGTAAREVLYEAARRNGRKIGELDSSSALAFFQAAGAASSTVDTRISLQTAIDNATTRINGDGQATAKLGTCVPPSTGLAVTSVSTTFAVRPSLTTEIPITVHGHGFDANTSFLGYPSPGPVVPQFKPTLVSSTELRGSIIVESDAEIGLHPIYVLEFSARRSKGFGPQVLFMFRILPPAGNLTVSSISPDEVQLTGSGAPTDVSVTLVGTAFAKGTTVIAPSPLKVTEVRFIDETQLQVTLEIPAGASAGTQLLKVENTNGETTQNLELLAPGG